MCYHEEDKIPCQGRDCEVQLPVEDRDYYLRRDYHGIPTGIYCDKCYDINYPYRRDDYTHGTGIADDGTPLYEEGWRL